MGAIRDPERDEYDNLYLHGMVGLPIYILADQSEQTAFCQRLRALADYFGKNLHILDYGKASLDEIRGVPRLVQEPGLPLSYTFAKPSWMEEGPMWLLATNLTEGPADPDDARVQFSALIAILPYAAAEYSDRIGVPLPKGSFVGAVVTRDRIEALRRLVHNLGEAKRSYLVSLAIRRNAKGVWEGVSGGAKMSP